MARSNNILLNVVLPIVVFVPLSITAYRFLFGHLQKAGLLKLDLQCPTSRPGNLPFQLQYLGGYAPVIENTLCILVAFFHPLFQPEAEQSSPVMAAFLASFAASVAIPFLEASRANRPLLLGFPVIMGIIYQMFTGAVVYPLYWALFLATTRDDPAGSQIDQAHAEGTLFGLVIGYALPSVAMVYIAAPEPIALWQAFPIVITAFQHIHLLFRPSRSHSGSGYRTVQATYILIFIASATIHLRTFAVYNFDLESIMHAFLPSLDIPDANKGHTGLTSAIHFLQWDFVLIFGSTSLVTLWFAENGVEAIQLLAWIVVASAVLSPGAAISAVFLWREANLNKARRLSASKLSKFH